MYISLGKDNWQQHSDIALGGVGSAPLLHLLEAHERIAAVSLCLDNDTAGIKAANRIEKVLLEKEYDVRTELPQGKDWNEDVTTRESEPSEMQLCYWRRQGARYCVD